MSVATPVSTEFFPIGGFKNPIDGADVRLIRMKSELTGDASAGTIDQLFRIGGIGETPYVAILDWRGWTLANTGVLALWTYVAEWERYIDLSTNVALENVATLPGNPAEAAMGRSQEIHNLGRKIRGQNGDVGLTWDVNTNMAKYDAEIVFAVCESGIILPEGIRWDSLV